MENMDTRTGSDNQCFLPVYFTENISRKAGMKGIPKYSSL
jgi:hypothetical protein